jgi:hypothetical protein
MNRIIYFLVACCAVSSCSNEEVIFLEDPEIVQDNPNNKSASLPIYDFIADPVKKAAVKAAVIQYIESKQIEVIKVIPLYRYYNNTDHYYETQWQPSYGSYFYERVSCYIYQNQIESTIPLYRYFNGQDHYYSTLLGNFSGYTYERITGYVYP